MFDESLKILRNVDITYVDDFSFFKGLLSFRAHPLSFADFHRGVSELREISDDCRRSVDFEKLGKIT